MDIGIGLPNSLLDVDGPELVPWALRAEERGFSVLGTIGRVTYASHEELVALAAAAGATQRIELMTSVLVAPPRQPVLLAKQAATLDATSGGRFRLGLGIGGRDDDWLALDEEPMHRGEKLEECIAVCRRVWAGERPAGADLPVGPQPWNLPIVLGGYSEAAFRRAGRLADAFIAAPMAPEAVANAYRIVRESAADAGRREPTLYAARYAAVGDDVAEEADRNAESYYAFGGAELVETVRDGVLRSTEAIRETLGTLSEIGVAETCLWPLARDIGQVDRVADAALEMALAR
jgi:alkanesulfonate monooxygenase SsuD/methylene tetrahydromethanopterin reductase-like flavin-dependent oxidoreductase (luciferase family)